MEGHGDIKTEAASSGTKRVRGDSSEEEVQKFTSNDMEDILWRNKEFFGSGPDVFKFGPYSVRFEHNKAREMNYLYLQKLNPKREVADGKDSSSYLDFSSIEMKDLVDYLSKILDEIDDTPFDSSIPSLKNSKVGKLNDPQEENFWGDKNLTKILDSGRCMIRPLVNGGCYSVVFRVVISQKLKEKFHNWLGPMIFFRVGELRVLSGLIHTHLKQLSKKTKAMPKKRRIIEDDSDASDKD